MDMMNSLEQQYQDMEQRRNMAYAAFSSIYDNEHPQPVEPLYTVERNGTITMLIIMVIASMIVSGSRTIPIFGSLETLPLLSLLVGFAAFAMVETGLVFLSFHRTRNGFNEARLKGTRKMAGFGLLVIGLVALSGNIQSVLELHGVVITQLAGTIINLVIAVSAPIMAYISGEILAVEWMRVSNAKRGLKFSYAAQIEQWTDTKSKSWLAQQTAFGAKIKVSVQQPSQISSQLVSHETTSGTVRERLVSHLSQYPQDETLSYQALADRTGLPKSSVGREMKKLKTGGG